MALLTRKDFAKLINKTPGYLGMYIKRNKLIEDNKKLDTNNSINSKFLSKYNEINSFKETQILERLDINKDESENNTPTPKQKPSSSKVNQGNIDYVVRQHDLEIKALKIRRENLELSIKESQILSVPLVTELFKIYIPGLTKEIIVNVDKLVDKLVDELLGDYETKLKYKKEVFEIINKTHENSHSRLTNEIIKESKKFKFKKV